MTTVRIENNLISRTEYLFIKNLVHFLSLSSEESYDSPSRFWHEKRNSCRMLGQNTLTLLATTRIRIFDNDRYFPA